jgi:hypothetical protein
MMDIYDNPANTIQIGETGSSNGIWNVARSNDVPVNILLYSSFAPVTVDIIFLTLAIPGIRWAPNNAAE